MGLASHTPCSSVVSSCQGREGASGDEITSPASGEERESLSEWLSEIRLTLCVSLGGGGEGVAGWESGRVRTRSRYTERDRASDDFRTGRDDSCCGRRRERLCG